MGILGYIVRKPLRVGFIVFCAYAGFAGVIWGQQPTIVEYPLPFNTLQAPYPSGITLGPDGNLWYCRFGSGVLGKITTAGTITEYDHWPGGTGPTTVSIASGPDGNLWTVDLFLNRIIKTATDGTTLAQYMVPGANLLGLNSIIAGPDGNMWFAGNQIGKITTGGTVLAQYSLPNAGAGSITQGPDGNLWFVEGIGKIGKISTNGAITEFTVPTVSAGLSGLTQGPDGNLWFTENQANKIGTITVNGAVTEFAVPTPSSGPTSITQGPDGALWFTESSGNKIGRIATDGIISEYSTPTPFAGPGQFGTHGIIAGPDGNLWFTESNLAIGELLLSHASCSYSISPGGQVFTFTGGSGSINVYADPGCPWTTLPVKSWATITSGAIGSGNGTVTYTVPPIIGSTDKNVVTLTVAGLPFTIEQQAASIPGLNFVGSMPHIAAEGNWSTTFTFVNKSTTATQTRFSLFGDAGSPLTLSLTFSQLPPPPGPLLGASLDRTLDSNASLILQAAGPSDVPVQVGSAQLAATGTVDGFAIFHHIPTAQEAVVPLETRNASSYFLAFDNTNGVALGIALENVFAQAATVPVVIRDETGAQIGTDTLSLAANGHVAFTLVTDKYPATANKRGTIEFDTPPGGQISALGIRFTPPGTLTTIPVLANVGTSGGSIAHIASGNGWQTTFVLINAGTSAAQAHVNFFDDNGSPLVLPISFTQSAPSALVSSVDQTLAAGSMQVFRSANPGANLLQTGSAQLTTDGHVGGFVIFRYNTNGQEAVVPLENRNANAYLLAFDNTGGTATGVAVNSVSAQPVNVPVIIRDDTGAQIGTGSIPFAANGHSSFTLAVDKFPMTAGIRGTIEFDSPPGAQIGALGIRIPPTQTFTTLPALVK